MCNALVSVVVPIYNVEKYLDRCITSIVNQTYRNLEIILVDDGSPDNCPSMCDRWGEKDSRIKVVHKENAGLGMARNTGIECATGDYICFFDSDDYIAEETIERSVTLAAEQEAEIVIYGVSNVNKDGRVFRSFVPQSEKVCFQGSEVQNEFLPDLIDCRHRDAKIKNLCLSAWSCLYSMELVRRTGWRFVSERNNISEDSFSLIWLYKQVSKVAVVQEAFYFHCENGSSLTRVYRADRFDKINQFYQETLTMAIIQGYPQKVLSRIAGLYLSFSIAAMKQIVSSDLDHRQKRKLIAQITADERMQKVLADPYCHCSTGQRKILFWTMRNHFHSLVWLCILFQLKRDAKNSS